MYVCIYQVGAEVTITEELLPQEVLVPLFVKSKNRGNFAAILTCNLFDKAILVKSNVRGRRKEMLDPEIIKFVKTKCFHYFPSEGDQEDEWKECVKSIDNKCKAIRKHQTNNNYCN